MSSNSRPSFLELWLEDTQDDVRRRGWWAIIPFSAITCILLGSAVSWLFPDIFFDDSSWAISSTVFAGLLAFNALAMALSWNAFGKIYELIAKPMFSDFLRKSGEMSRYMFYISYFHLTQVAAAGTTLFGFVWLFFPVSNEWADRIVLAVVFATTFYGLRWSIGAVRVAHDLVWNFGKFDGLPDDDKRALKLAVSNTKD